jgi:hypothetical protein
MMSGNIFVFFESRDAKAAAFATKHLTEGRTYQIDKKWSVRVDRPHAPGMDDHVHVYCRNNEVAVINRNGTPSHGSDLNKIPKWIRDHMRSNKLAESRASSILDAIEPLVPAEVIAQAIYTEELMMGSVQELDKTPKR